MNLLSASFGSPLHNNICSGLYFTTIALIRFVSICPDQNRLLAKTANSGITGNAA
jgi:hypothetical protein